MKWFLLSGVLIDLSKVMAIQADGLKITFVLATGGGTIVQLDSLEQVAHAFEAMKSYLEAVYPVLPEASRLVRN